MIISIKFQCFLTNQDKNVNFVRVGIKIAHINVCGWTNKNNTLRQNLITSINADTFSICETHLANHSVINVPDYTWYGFNRA